MRTVDSELIEQLFETIERIDNKLDKLLEKTKGRVRKAKTEYPEWFERAWGAYPKRLGSNPKGKALSAAYARHTESTGIKAVVDMENGVKRYCKFCDATGKTGTEYVMQAATFFGPDKHYENDWTVPYKPAELPRDEELHVWAKEHGVRSARVGETWGAYRAALKRLLAEKLI